MDTQTPIWFNWELNQYNFKLNFIWRARSKGSIACKLLLSRKSTGAARRKKSIGIGGDWKANGLNGAPHPPPGWIPPPPHSIPIPIPPIKLPIDCETPPSIQPAYPCHPHPTYPTNCVKASLVFSTCSGGSRFNLVWFTTLMHRLVVRKVLL